MAFIRAKRTANNTYYQLVENTYAKGKVRQKVLKHLGTEKQAKDYALRHDLKIPKAEKKKIVWKRAWARKYSVQKLEAAAQVFVSCFKKNIGVSITDVLVTTEGTNKAFYADLNQWNGIGKKLLELCKKDGAWKKIYEKTIKYSKQYAGLGRRIAKTNLRALSNRELASVYKEFFNVHSGEFEYYLWLPFFIDEFVFKELRKRLEGEFGGEAQEVLLVVASPSKINAITRESIALMELAIKVKEENLSEQSINELLQKHAENFCWLAVYDFDEEPWKVEHFGERLKTLCYKNTKELKQEILETEKQYLHNHEEFEKVLKKIKDPTLKNLALTGHAFAYLKDARDDYRREGNYLAEPLFAETARRAGLTQKEAIQLTSREIINFLRTGHVDRARVRERLNGFTVTMQCSRLHVYSGEEAKQKAEEQLQRTSSEKRGVVKGIPGALGTARGPACIIRHKLLLHKVKPGDILISNTTMPDYVPAMKKAKAVVTDEGGITCHAAIVCRELKIPCVVGTQTATKEFEDGDLVEVDAEHGIVKKINVPKKKTRNTMKELAKRSFKASKTAGELCKEAEEDFW